MDTDLAYRIGRRRLELARRATLALLQDIPAEGWLHQPVPRANHVLWTLGHLAANDDTFLARLSGGAPGLGEDWHRSFATGSHPTGDRTAYPDPDTVRAELERTRAALLHWLGRQTPEALTAPLPEPLQPFGDDLLDLMPSLAWHEGWHAGQISVVRRSLGLPVRFG